MDDDVRLVWTTAPDEATAAGLARALVQERLAACVNVLPAMSSVYRWRGAVEEAREHLLVAKTTAGRAQALLARLRELHPYDVPEGVVVPVDGGLPAYLAWVAQETRAG